MNVFGEKVFFKNKTIKEKNNTQRFDENCFTAKQEFKSARNAFIQNKTDETRIHFCKMRTKYNRVKKKAKFKFKKKEGQRLENIA